MTTLYKVLQVMPAPANLKAYYLQDDGTHEAIPVAGFGLLECLHANDPKDGFFTETVALVPDGDTALLEPADLDSNFVGLLYDDQSKEALASRAYGGNRVSVSGRKSYEIWYEAKRNEAERTAPERY